MLQFFVSLLSVIFKTLFGSRSFDFNAVNRSNSLTDDRVAINPVSIFCTFVSAIKELYELYLAQNQHSELPLIINNLLPLQ